jgi:hypothetical protein
MNRHLDQQIEHQAWLRRDPDYHRRADYIPSWQQNEPVQIDHRHLVEMMDIAGNLMRMAAHITQEEGVVDTDLYHAYTAFARELPGIERSVREFHAAMIGSPR